MSFIFNKISMARLKADLIRHLMMKLSTYISHALAASDNNFLLANHQQQRGEPSEVTIHT